MRRQLHGPPESFYEQNSRDRYNGLKEDYNPMGLSWFVEHQLIRLRSVISRLLACRTQFLNLSRQRAVAAVADVTFSSLSLYYGNCHVTNAPFYAIRIRHPYRQDTRVDGVRQY